MTDDAEKRRRFHAEQHKRQRQDMEILKGMLANMSSENHKLIRQQDELKKKVFEQALKISHLSKQMEQHNDTARKMGQALRELATQFSGFTTLLDSIEDLTNGK